MRSDQEILDLVLSFARNDDNIRLVVLNGSRANPNARKDPFQDFDVACLVRDLTPYRQNLVIPACFGDLMILQLPDDMHGEPPDNNSCYAFLMQFMDGVRIDLSFHTLDQFDELISDSLTVVLLDKDCRVRDLPPASEVGYLPQPPTAKLFFDCCNEFWWVTPYVAKGLWRDELTYATAHLDILREQLMIMLVWYVGVQTDFQKSPGKSGKYLKKYLDPSMWSLLERTYSDAQLEHIWDSLFVLGDLFRQTGRCVAAHFHFPYPELEDQQVTRFIQHIRYLPRDARSIY